MQTCSSEKFFFDNRLQPKVLSMNTARPEGFHRSISERVIAMDGYRFH
jgi:hypothetical protein